MRSERMGGGKGGGRGSTGEMHPPRPPAGVSLIELLCVMTIITILASMLLPAVMRAYSRVRGFAEEFESGDVFHLLTTEAQRYCAAHPHYVFASKSDFVSKCRFAPKPQALVQAQATVFVPFAFPDDTNNIVLTFHIGPTQTNVVTFTKGDLTITPQRR